jgi:hypothetical protein
MRRLPTGVSQANKEMDTIKGIRLLAASLLTLLGIVYLALTTFPDYLAYLEIEAALVALVGLVYVATGIGLFVGKRLFNYLGAVVPLIWASMGILHYIAVKPDPIEFPFIAIEAVIALCCCYLILHKKSS